MEFFIDTADVEAIRKANDMGFISGVTTNPSLIAKEGKDFHATIKEIASIVDGPISAEVLADDAEGMIEEGKVLGWTGSSRGSEDSYDPGRHESSQGPEKTGNPHQCDPGILCQPGTARSPRRRFLCKPLRRPYR